MKGLENLPARQSGHSWSRSTLTRLLVIPLLCTLLFMNAEAWAAGEQPSGQLFNAADSDGNGLLSEGEWHTAMQKRFEKLDSNKDGNLSREEIEQTRGAIRGKFRGLRNSNTGLLGN